MSKMYAPSKMDGSIRAVSASIVVFFAVFLIPALTMKVLPLAIVAVLLGLLIAITWQMRPANYTISDGAVIIPRGWPFKTISIPIAEIHEVRPITISGSPSQTVRTFGNGGLFGWGGQYWNHDIGDFFAAATSTTNNVLISSGKKFVISPAEPEQFIAEINSRLNR
jgi:hypothetical protein